MRLLLIRLFKYFKGLKKIFVDGGYKKGCIEWAFSMFGYVLEVVKRLGNGFAVLRKRWIVERTFAWLSFYRRLVKDYEHNPKCSEANVKIVMIFYMVTKLPPP